MDYYSAGSLSAEYHDLLADNDPHVIGDVDYYAQLATKPLASFLDLGCGHGRVTFALAAKGFNVTGVDRAPAMLEKAEARRECLPADEAARVTLIAADMATIDLGRSFDAVLLPFFGLNHFDETLRVAVLDAVIRHLAPGGRAAFHLIPDAWFSPLTPEVTERPALLMSGPRQLLQVRPKHRILDGPPTKMTTTLEYRVYELTELQGTSEEHLVQYQIADEELERFATQHDLLVLSRQCPFRPHAPRQRVMVLAQRWSSG